MRVGLALITLILANDVVLKYLRKQNRPYSAVDLFNNLKGEVGKSNIQKILQTMVDDGN